MAHEKSNGDSLLERLPGNILFDEILLMLDKPENTLTTLCTLTCVSRTLHSSINTHLRSLSSIDLSGFSMDLRTFCQIRKRFKELKKIKLDCLHLNDDVLSSRNFLGVPVEELILLKGSSLSSDFVFNIKKWCPNIRVLTVHLSSDKQRFFDFDNKLNNLLKDCRCLESLEIKVSREKRSGNGFKIPGNFYTLPKTLKILKLDMRVLLGTPTFGPTLTHISLVLDIITDILVLAISLEIKVSREKRSGNGFKITGNFYILPKTLKILKLDMRVLLGTPTFGPTLTHISLVLDIITDILVLAIVNSCPLLVELELIDTPISSTSSSAELSNPSVPEQEEHPIHTKVEEADLPYALPTHTIDSLRNKCALILSEVCKNNNSEHETFVDVIQELADLVTSDLFPLNAVWPHSGHYLPTEENFEAFISFLEQHNVNLHAVKMTKMKAGFGMRNSVSEPVIFGGTVEASTKTYHRKNSRKDQRSKSLQLSTNLKLKITTLEIPQNEKVMTAFQKKAIEPDPESDPDSTTDYDTAEEFLSDFELMVTKRNLFDYGEEDGAYDENVPKEKIMKRINLHKENKSFQLANQLSCRWTTGAGPCIGCVRDYPLELQTRVMEEMCLSPRSTVISPTRFGPTNMHQETGSPIKTRTEKCRLCNDRT
ncbi:hypothetical protein CTI12_AA469510 [Artemisia annua]|uniref:F-box/LRR-repeat protein 15-like leucin rich repeat domain-containing protein n=1 Tax=Artemisia annua TaxID=35608 RepID=A0A2U1LN71_ARTAN|nr:hypothetical protein CTI12_AA469510 [Artemisia annua]